VGTLLLQPEYRGPHLSQKGGPVYLVVQLVRLQLLYRAGQGAKCRYMGSNALSIEAADSAVLSNQPGGTRRRRIEVVLQIQVRAAEIVDGRRARYRDPSLSFTACRYRSGPASSFARG
jgi:hypothetical protein